MKKILCCSPYMPGAKNVSGGIAIWTAAIFEYYQKVNKKIDLEIFPFTRKISFNDNAPIWKRLPAGLFEYGIIVNRLRKRLKANDVDVIHLCSSASISLLKDYLIIKCAQAKNVKTVVHFHFGRIPELSCKKNWEWKLLVRILKDIDVAITMSLESYSVLKDAGFKNVEYLPNPLSDDVLQKIAIANDSIKKEDKSLLFVGHGYITKGVYELINGCVKVSNAHLRVVGRFDMALKKELESIASKRNNGTWLEFVGEIPHDEVLKEMSKADIFVFPSYTEGFPYVILEAMAAKCAIISTGVGAIPEMLTGDDTKCGLLIPVKDENAVQLAVEQLFANKELRKEIALNAYNRVNELYTIKAVWEKLSYIWTEAHGCSK